MLKLTPRLMTIAKLVNNCNVLADIGTDHAYLPAYLILNNKCSKAIASDIKKGPLMRAEATAVNYKVSDKIDLRLGPGLKTVNLCDNADTIVIAGMGGLIISDILSASPEVVKNARRIILQPMTMAPELRRYLYNAALGDITEHLAFEGDKIYIIISVDIKPDAKAITLTPAEEFVGKSLAEKMPNGFDRYADYLINKLRNQISGLKNGETTEAKLRLSAAEKLLKDTQNLIKY